MVTLTVAETIMRFPEICYYLEYFQLTDEKWHSDISARSISLLNYFCESYIDCYHDCYFEGYRERNQIGMPVVKEYF